MRRTYRNRFQAIVTGVIAAAFLSFIPYGLYSTSVPIPAKPVWIGLGLILGPFWLRAASSSVMVDNEGIRIRNPLSTRSFSWKQVVGFSIGRWTVHPHVAFVDLTDGRRHHIYGIQGPNPAFRPKARSAEKLVEALRKELDATRASDS